MTCIFADPKEWLLEITPTIAAQSWQQSRNYTTPSSCWRAYINQICLHAFMDWVKTESFSEASVGDITDTLAFYEFFNGIAISSQGKRIVLIPSEAVDDGEIEVPQEWIDIPSWAGDYYLAVQVNADTQWLRVWGYTTHHDIKSKSYYDSVDRTYCIEACHITKDLNAFWMIYQFCQAEEIKAAISPLAELSPTQAENFLQRLSNSSATFPRLTIPFITWGALLENEEWRQRLYQQTQQPPLSQVQINLSRWLEGIYDHTWEAIDVFFTPNSSNFAFSLRNNSQISAVSIKRAKLIDLGMELNSYKVILLLALIPESNQQISIRIQLHPVSGDSLPADIKLALLSPTEELIQEVQSREQDNYVQLKRFYGQIGENFNIKVIFNKYQITENFMI